MNKTVTINLSGIVYHIDEDAYQKLAEYLQTLRNHFESEQSADEILSDIEARMSELLQIKMTHAQQVVTMADVEELISIMGTPEDFGAETTSENTHKTASSTSKKRLYRDSTNRVIGGVCSGIAHYFGVDPVLVRVAFLLVFFVFGPLVYGVAWIIIPKAVTTKQKLEMQGESIDIESIKERVKEEINDVKDRFAKYGAEMQNKYGKSYKQKVKEEARYYKAKAHTYKKEAKEQYQYHREKYKMAPIVEFMFKIVGMFIFIVISVVLLSIFTDFSFVAIWQGLAHIPEYVKQVSLLFFADTSVAYKAELALLGIIFLPVLSVIWGGLMILLGVRHNFHKPGIVIGILWIICVVFGIMSGFKISHEFEEKAKVKEVTLFNADSLKTLIISKESKGLPNSCFVYNDEIITIDKWNFAQCDNNLEFVSKVELSVISCIQDSISVEVKTKSYGQDLEQATMIANELQFEPVLTDSIIRIPQLILPQTVKQWRGQEVKVIVKVPENITYKVVSNGELE